MEIADQGKIDLVSLLQSDVINVVIIAFSGGKDSLACVLHLLEIGVPKEKMELWHHEIDGREGSTLMDWNCTPSYCRKVAQALGIPIYFSWRKGGFEREMLRDNEPTAATVFETPDGIQEAGGKSNKLGTRLKFPQVSGDLSVRWCSAYLKISIMDTAIANQPRFNGKTIVTISGERREESPGRAKYKEFEQDRTHSKKRNAWRWRPIIDWSEQQVWDIIKRWRMRVHPGYYLGWSRVSCMFCIFASPDQMASAYKLEPMRVSILSAYEKQFGVTIQRKDSIPERIAKGNPYPMRDKDILAGMTSDYNLPIFFTANEKWHLPAGAFKSDKSGPS